MRTYHWEGTATALSSIAQGGRTLGTVTYLRRERFLLPDGTVEEIPVISGNGVRGVLRDTAATMMWNDLGQPRLPHPVVHALWSGGALVKAKGQPLSGQRLARLRNLVPHIGVFGAAGGGRIIDGALQVGKLLPVCAQTAHLLPEHMRAVPLPDMFDLVQIEEYTRLPTTERLDTTVTAGVNLDSTYGQDSDPDETYGSDGLMRFGAETLIAGTQFHCWFGLTDATGTEHNYFVDALTRYQSHAIVGGRSARGHGLLNIDITEQCVDGQPEAGEWRTPIANRDAVTEVLRWLD